MPAGICYDINKAAAEIARRAADSSIEEPSKPRFVAGSIDSLWTKPVYIPGYGVPQSSERSADEAKSLCWTGTLTWLTESADILLVETIFDVLNCKSAIYAVRMCSRNEYPEFR